MRPGLMFTAFPLPYAPPTRLEPTMSTYCFGDRLESGPKKNDIYVVCQDGSIKARDEPDRPIGWELLETDDGWAYRITQVNHKPKPLAVSFYGWADEIPNGGGRIGSIVTFERKIITPPSTPRESSPECPGAPVKNLNPM